MAIDDEGETSGATDGSLYVFEGADYSKSSADDDKAFDAIIAGKFRFCLFQKLQSFHLEILH